MVNKSQQYYKRTLTAGVTTTIDSGAEFVYIESGREVTVIADSNRAANRRKGDTIRYENAVKSVSFVSSIDQVIEVTMGFGEFNRVIVEGELNVSAYVLTNSGVADSLPFEFTKRVFVDQADTFSTICGTLTINSDDISNELPNYDNSACAFWRDRWFGLNKNEINEINEITGSVTLLANLNWTSAKNNDPYRSINAMTVTPSGVIYFLCDSYLYKTSFSGYVQNVSEIPCGSNSKSGGIFCIGGKVYVPVFSDDRGGFDFKVYDVELNKWSSVPISLDLPGCDNSFLQFVYDPSNGLILAGVGGYYSVVTVGGNYVGDVVDGGNEFLSSASSQRQTAISLDGVRAIKGAGDKYTFNDARTQDYYGSIYTQDGDDVSTKKIVYLTEQADFIIGGGEVLVSGAVAEWMIKTLVPSDNYLDYLVSVTHDNGMVKRKVSSGTQTFKYRNMKDYFTVKSGTDVTLEMLPEFFE